MRGSHRAQNDKLSTAQKTRAKADDTRREAEEEVAQKANEFRWRLEEQTSRQTAEVKQRLSEQAKKRSRRRAASAFRSGQEGARRASAKWSSPSSRRRPHDSRSRKPGVRRSPTLSSRSNKPRAWPRRKRPSLASLTPVQTAPPTSAQPPLQMDQPDITRLLQAHLKRVGCAPGKLLAHGRRLEKSARALQQERPNHV